MKLPTLVQTNAVQADAKSFYSLHNYIKDNRRKPFGRQQLLQFRHNFLWLAAQVLTETAIHYNNQKPRFFSS